MGLVWGHCGPRLRGLHTLRPGPTGNHCSILGVYRDVDRHSPVKEGSGLSQPEGLPLLRATGSGDPGEPRPARLVLVRHRDCGP